MREVGLIAAAGGAAWTFAHNRAPAVQAWRRPRAPVHRHGPLAYRVTGPIDADTGILLLHGLVATGDVFGTTPELLGQCHRVVVPDLLGFGRSLDENRTDFSTHAHLEALDDLVTHELCDRAIRIGAHSMGSALGLRYAAAHPERVERVACIGPPAWPDPDSARAALGSLGPMGRSLLLDDRLARAVCAFNCRHRTLAGLLSAAVAPRWPIPVARQASLHTWDAYIQALQDQIIECPWGDITRSVTAHQIPVDLTKGTRDLIDDDAFLEELGTYPDVSHSVVTGDHTLPAARPDLLADLLAPR